MTSLTKRQKEMALIVLAVVFLLALSAYSYFIVFAPSKDSLAQAEQTLTSEREVVMALETQLKEVPEGERISTSELQEKVAIEPLADLIVLQIEQAELISGTRVMNIAFTEGPFELLQPVEGVENIQEVLTTVELEAADYASITSFIREIEMMNRIMVVDSIDFQANDEVTTQDATLEPIAVTLNFSAFYRPDLIALADTLPKVDIPAPANKANPLPQNDGTELADEDDVSPVVPADEPELDVDVDVSIDDDSASAAPVESNPNVAGAQTATLHKVEKGETLFSISIEYFGNRTGEALIQEANDLASSTVIAGTTLVIPERP